MQRPGVPRGAPGRLFLLFTWRDFFLAHGDSRHNIPIMFDDESQDAANATEAEAMGRKRFASMSMFDSPVLFLPDPVWSADVRALAKKQLRATTDPETLLCGYIELLGRAKTLVEFWENNVGQTEDWPVSVIGDTAEVEDCLFRRVQRLHLAVSFVEESACS